MIVGSEFADSDFAFLSDLFAMFDSKLAELQSRIDQSDADSSGLYDCSDFLAGSGFVACQTYLTSTFGPVGVPKETALSVGPLHAGGRTYAAILNAAANFWKHQEEWGLGVLVARDVDALGPREKKTLEVIESVTPWSDYVFVNLLFELTGEIRFAGLLPKLEEWRRHIAAVPH